MPDPRVLMLACSLGLAGTAGAADIVRRPNPGFPIASSVAGYTMGDVVRMNVFLVGDPRKGGGMDFEGLMKAYSERFGSAAQPILPARTTVQVAGLPVPGALVEIEVVAARIP